MKNIVYDPKLVKANAIGLHEYEAEDYSDLLRTLQWGADALVAILSNGVDIYDKAVEVSEQTEFDACLEEYEGSRYINIHLFKIGFDNLQSCIIKNTVRDPEQFNL